jgi:hypothetical protein
MISHLILSAFSFLFGKKTKINSDISPKRNGEAEKNCGVI